MLVVAAYTSTLYACAIRRVAINVIGKDSWAGEISLRFWLVSQNIDWLVLSMLVDIFTNGGSRDAAGCRKGRSDAAKLNQDLHGCPTANRSRCVLSLRTPRAPGPRRPSSSAKASLEQTCCSPCHSRIFPQENESLALIGHRSGLTANQLLIGLPDTRVPAV